jgi:hypothetical protein
MPDAGNIASAPFFLACTRWRGLFEMRQRSVSNSRPSAVVDDLLKLSRGAAPDPRRDSPRPEHMPYTDRIGWQGLRLQVYLK